MIKIYEDMKNRLFILLILTVGISLMASAQGAYFYKRYAEKGDKEAMYNLAICYMYGDEDVAQDFGQAIFWLNKAVKKKYAPAEVTLAYCYIYGIGVLKDYQKAWELCCEAAKQNNGAAFYYMSQMCKEGMYARQDNSLYYNYLVKAAGLGFAKAVTELAGIYMSGNENPYVTQDIERGLSLYKMAAEQNDGEALLQLGLIYRDGIEGVVEPDPETGYQYIMAAAETGIPRATFEYGYVTLYGMGCTRDYTTAYRFIYAAAEQGVPDAYGVMGGIYFYGYGVEVDAAEAAKWYQKAVDAEYVPAYTQLASMYIYGIGVTEDETKAFKLIKKSADTGYVLGYAWLGWCYRYGSGVDKNIELAILNYKKAADSGDNYSCLSLYLLYRDGEGVDRDWAQSLRYLREAADAEIPEALGYLGKEYMLGELLGKDKTKAIKYLTLSADANCGYAAAVLGTLYYSGEDLVERDYDKAFKYLSIAVNQKWEDEDEKLLALVCRDLGACYRFGRGTSVDHSYASFYTEQAAKYGDNGSSNAMEIIRK